MTIANQDELAAVQKAAEAYVAALRGLAPPLAETLALDIRQTHRRTMNVAVQGLLAYFSHKNPEAGLDFLLVGAAEGLGSAIAQAGPDAEANGIGAITAGLEYGVKGARRAFQPQGPRQ